ncbi:MAG: peptide chain release factor-like protein [Planctomycetes bacterium]|nr:peptide chain release factor-like protein [Planctomycetota bacterium]
MPAPYAISDDALLAQCDITSSSSHGPGGQHRNKTESAVRLRHRPTGLMAQCEDHRERSRNRVEAVARLRLRLVIATRGSSDAAWLDPYRRGRQVTLRENARDYHLVAACCLDALEHASGSLAEAAATLAISSTQLVKLVVADKEVHQAANQLRQRFSLGAIRG